jgi:hypothetical protein
MSKFKYYNDQITEQVTVFAQYTLTSIEVIMIIENHEQPEVHYLLCSALTDRKYWLNIKLDWSDTYQIQVQTTESKEIYKNEYAFFDDIYEIMKEMHEKKPFGEDFSNLIFKD